MTELDDKDADARIRLARLYLLGGAPKRAQKFADAASKLEPKNASIYALKAAILYRLKDSERARELTGKALEIDPRNTDVLVVVATQQFIKGDAPAALKTLSNLDSKTDSDTGVILLKINIYNKLGNLEQVEALLHKLIALNPNVAVFRNQLIRFYLAHNRKDDAEKALRARAKAESGTPAAELDLVSFLSSVRGYESARVELLRKINAGGDVFPFKMALARLDFANGKAKGAIDSVEQLIKSSTAPDQITAARLTLANMYLSQKQIEKVEPLVTQVLDADKSNTEALRLRALVLLQRNKVDDAIAVLRQALNEQPKSPSILTALSIAYERSGSIDLANKALFDATKASNYAPNIGLAYVAFLQRRGFSTQAEMTLGELVKRHPKDLSVLATLARDRIAHQDWAAAHEIANEIRQSKSQTSVADQIDAAAFSGEKKPSDSLAALKQAYEASPDALSPLVALVQSYMRAGQADKAEEAVNRALKLNSSDANAMVLLGALKLSKGNSSGAQSEFENAIRTKPKNPAGYRALANLYLRQSKPDDAIAILRKGLKVEPNSFPLGLTLAGILEVKKDYNGAIAEYETLIKQQPGSMIVANNLASLIADHRDDRSSIDRARSLIAMLKESQVPQFQDTVGWVSYREGDYQTALSALKSAAEKMPNYAVVRYHLGMTYLADGDRAQATEQFKKAQNLAPHDEELKSKIDSALKSPPPAKGKENPQGSKATLPP